MNSFSRVFRAVARTLSIILAMSMGAKFYGIPSAVAQQRYDPAPIPWAIYRKMWVPGITTANKFEAERRTADLELARSFLDDVAVKWVRHNGCGTCHTSIPYLMATPRASEDAHQTAAAEVRERVLDYAEKHIQKTDDFTFFDVPAAASGLALQSSMRADGSDSRVQALFAWLWERQDPDGTWHYPSLNVFVPFLERDQTYVALLVALAAGYSPEQVLIGPHSESGMTNLRVHLLASNLGSLHHRAVLLWASQRTPGLLDEEHQRHVQAELIGVQAFDGGWALPALGTWVRHDGPSNDPHGPSDGYATGLATLALCESGMGSSIEAQRGTAWLNAHQRVSGRWYTRSLWSTHFKNYLSNLGTAYAIMAIESCRKHVAMSAEQGLTVAGRSGG